MQPSSDRPSRDVERGVGYRGDCGQRNRRSNDIELSSIGNQPVQVITKTNDRGHQSGAAPADRGGSSSAKSPNRHRNSKHVNRNPFGNPRNCKYHHSNCVYDPRLRKCRRQLTPVAEVSTPESNSRGLSSAGTVSSRKSRPGTPMAIPGSAKRVPSPDYYSDNDCSYVENEDGLPSYIPESENGVTTLKATATVTLELTSSSSSIPYRVTRLHSQNE